MALLFSFAVGRLLLGVTSALASHRAYWIHSLWVISGLIGCFIAWWGFWLTRDAEWSAFRFVWALMLPVLLFIRAHVLLGAEFAVVESFRAHFFQVRVRFFAIGIAVTLHSVASPWIYGFDRLAWNPALSASVVPLLLNGAGIALEAERAHAVIAICMFLATASALFLLPTTPPG